MIRRERLYAAQHAFLLALCALAQIGCANLRLPAIDPYGRRIFLPRPAYTTVNSSPPGGFLPQPAFSAPPPPDDCYAADGSETYEPLLPLCQREWPIVDRLFGPVEDDVCYQNVDCVPSGYGVLCVPMTNVDCLPAPLSYDPRQSIPYDPCLPTLPQIQQNTVPPSQQATVAPLAPAPAVAGAATPAAAQPRDFAYASAPGTRGVHAARLQVNPARLVAPVGREVILRAGLCGDDGYLIRKQPIEWSLSQDSVGSFVEVDQFKKPLWRRLFSRPPDKQSSTYAIGRTSTAPQVLTRGTLDTSDDVLLAEGQTWISVTSASEGVSHVSAVAPTAAGWSERRQTASIHWVDGQWTFPPPSFANAGTSRRITTNVTRATSAAPITGWIVRYEILDNASGGERRELELLTDTLGNATADVTPLTDQPGITQIRIQVIRVGGPGDLERLVVGEGTTSITWTTTVSPSDAPYVPPTTTTPPPTQPGATFPTPSFPTPSIPAPSLTTPSPAAPQPDEPASATEQPTPAVQNRLRVSITGPETARTGERVSFTISITNLSNEPLRQVLVLDEFDSGLGHIRGSSPIDWPISLGAGEIRDLPLRFMVLSPGQHCHTVTVTSGDGSRATARACVRGVGEPGAATTPPPDSDPFGSDPFEGAALSVEARDRGLNPPAGRSTAIRAPDELNQIKFDRIRGDENTSSNRTPLNKSFRPGNHDLFDANGAFHHSPANTSPRAKTAGLRVTVSDLGDPARVNQRLTYVVMIHNERDVSDRNVVLTVTLPKEAQFETSINPPMIRARNATPDRRTVEFLPLAELRAGESATYRIVATSALTGSGRFVAEVTSALVRVPVIVAEDTTFFRNDQ